MVKQAMAFNEDWFSDQLCDTMTSWARDTLHLSSGLFLEVGSWEGKSTCALANAIYPHVLHNIDTWEGNLDEYREKGGHPTIQYLAERDVYATFKENIAALTQGNVITHKQDFRIVPDEILSSGLRFFFLDHDHTYPMTKAAFDLYLPLIVPGGILCGDDCGVPGIKQACEEYLPGYSVDHNLFYWRKPL